MDESDYEVMMTERIENTTLKAIDASAEAELFDTRDKQVHTQTAPRLTGIAALKTKIAGA